MPLDLDPRYTFDSFIVGSANRLAAAAAKRVAEAPGIAYNPLFLYSASGLGKTHLVMAIGNHIRRLQPDLNVLYDTLEHLMDAVMSAIQAGDRDAFRGQLRDVPVLLLDDVQFLAGRRGAQDELLRAWDGIAARGGQLVLASDRPPNEIDDLDQRLLSRFSGGLVTDVGVPDYETRAAIVTRKAEERGQELASGVAETIARVSYANVRELQGALNRVLAVQELESRVVEPDEAARMLGLPASAGGDEFGNFLVEVTDTLDDVVAQLTPEQRLADAILRYEGEGFRTARLEAGLVPPPAHAQVDVLVEQFDWDVERLLEITRDIRELDPDAKELDTADVLRNPDRLVEAETLLAQVRERMAPLPGAPPGPDFDALTLSPELLAMRAVRAVAAQPGERYNPLYIAGPASSGKTSLIIALARALEQERPELPLAFTTGERFAGELIAAIGRNQVDAWRARYRRARVLVIDDVDALVGTERAQEELFHLYDAVRRSHGQLVFSGSVPPRELAGMEGRLRSRLESGLVIDLAAVASEPPPAPTLVPEPPAPRAPQVNAVLMASDKVLWHWPHLEDTLLLDPE
jgi:chromosomal replication initiation ATPase DnaA